MRKAAALGGLLISIGSVVACGSAAGSENGSAERNPREDALSRASVFRSGFTPDGLAPGRASGTAIECRFLLTDVSGTSPKFDCQLPDGQQIKVKYGANPEISGEIAATRLLSALGFGADRVALAARVRCYGCPASPFYSRLLAKWTSLDQLLARTRNYREFREFNSTAVEHKLAGEALDANGEKGWSFFELDRIDPTRGGASREEVDALRLIAVFLAHWDNKAPNQRLVCLPPKHEGRCRRPLVMLQDVGATFGPRKVSLSAWRDTPVWSDSGCGVSMKNLPHEGATFPDTQISDGGRRLLAGRLGGLSPAQIRTLFLEANFPDDVDEWVNAFQNKVREIALRTCAR